jgi:hypothetical protein
MSSTSQKLKKCLYNKFNVLKYSIPNSKMSFSKASTCCCCKHEPKQGRSYATVHVFDGKIRLASSSNKVECDKAIAELGEFKKLGRVWYLVKSDGIYNINLNISKEFKNVHEINTILGDKTRFSSVNEAEEFWIAQEEAEIMAEARRRFEEEERLAAEAAKAAEREARIQAAMARLRSEKTSP